MNKRLILGLLAALMIVPAAKAAESFSDRTLALRPVHYGLAISVDYENKAIRGDCRLTLTNASVQPVSSVPLLLFRLLKATSIHDGQGRELPFRQQVVSFEDWETIQVNFIEADLAVPLAAGDRQVLDIAYAGHLTGYSEDGMLYVKDKVDEAFTIIRMDSFAYPEIGYPSWKANRAAGLPSFDYDLGVTVPGSLVVANAGQLTARSKKDGSMTFTYRSLKPSWRIDIAIAAYRQNDDTAKGLRVFSLAGDQDGARAVMDAVQGSMALFASLLGSLPAKAGFSIIEVPEGYGSHADAACILLTRDAFRDKTKFYQLYHEVSHLWNVNSLDPQPSRFESEGLAMFLQYYAQEKLEGQRDAVAKAATRLLENIRSDLEKDPKGALTAMIDYGQADLTDLSYTKGMIFFDLLFNLMGESDFFKSLAGFDRQYAATGATARQFLDWMSRSSSVSLDGMFKEWVTGTESSKDIFDRLSFNQILKKYRR